MNRPSMEDGHVRMPEEEFEELLELAAERGAKSASRHDLTFRQVIEHADQPVKPSTVTVGLALFVDYGMRSKQERMKIYHAV